MPCPDLNELSGCVRCPRLVSYRQAVQPKKGRRAEHYWNRPVSGFGDPGARICLVGLAPGAHGANRTGRPFTGDGAGDFMYPLLHRVGLASRPDVIDSDDGLQLKDLYLTNAVKCVPPGNKPIALEFTQCRPYLEKELASLDQLRLIFALGGDAFRSLLHLYRHQGHLQRFSDFPFGHGVTYCFKSAPILVGSYHTSRYNIQTGRLTEKMFVELLQRVVSLLD